MLRILPKENTILIKVSLVLQESRFKLPGKLPLEADLVLQRRVSTTDFTDEHGFQ